MKLSEGERQQLQEGLQRIAELDAQLEGAQRGLDEASQGSSDAQSTARQSVRSTRSTKEQATTSSRLAYGVRYTDAQDVQRQLARVDSQQDQPRPAPQKPDYSALLEASRGPATQQVCVGQTADPAGCRLLRLQRQTRALTTQQRLQQAHRSRVRPSQSSSSSWTPCSWSGAATLLLDTCLHRASYVRLRSTDNLPAESAHVALPLRAPHSVGCQQTASVQAV